MKTILVDDEPAMHLILRKMLAKLPEIQVEGAFTNAQAATAFLRDNREIGLAFVDISMAGESGLSFAAATNAAGFPVQIVFVTSHKEYALEAFELSVLDYLVKPVTQERLQRTVQRALAVTERLRRAEAEAVNETTGRTVVTVLGDVVVSNETGRVKWISRKCAELFAYLLLHRGRRIPRSRLIPDIFGGMEHEQALKYLNTSIYQLRKSLEPLGLRDIVRSENDGYALELAADCSIDCEEFERQARGLQVITAENAEQAGRIERSYTGDLFGDRAYVWAVHETDRYSELYASLVGRLAEYHLSMRNPEGALSLLAKLNQRNPLDESVVRLLMLTRERMGDVNGINALYADYVRLLDRELGIRPSDDLVGYYEERLGRSRNN